MKKILLTMLLSGSCFADCKFAEAYPDLLKAAYESRGLDFYNILMANQKRSPKEDQLCYLATAYFYYKKEEYDIMLSVFRKLNLYIEFTYFNQWNEP